MAQDITAATPIATIVSFLRNYIVAASDGSQQLKESELGTWLSEQVGYSTGSGYAGYPNDKDADVADIVAVLAGAISKEAFVLNPAFPSPGSGNTNANATERLIKIREEMDVEVAAIEAPFKEFRAGLAARTRTLFNSVVAPSFPAGSRIDEETRIYVETFVTDKGEESQPSPASALLTLDSNDTVTITCNAAPVGRNVAKRRIYRSATGTSTSAFKLQGEYPIATVAVTDAKPASQLNDICPTFGWLEPPPGLKGLTGIDNGMMLGFVGFTLYVCEPYHPYAYPAKYDKPLASQIVGIVAINGGAFIGTTGRPYVVYGTDAASLSEERIGSKVPCASAQSMVAIESSVFYASPDGIALFENGQVANVTQDLISRKDWQSYVPSTMRAAEYDGMYFVYFTKVGGEKGCLIFDYKSRSLVERSQGADAVFSDATGIYTINGTGSQNALPTTGPRHVAVWKSKTFRLPKEASFGWIAIDSDFDNNGVPTTVTVKTYANDVLHHVAVVSTSAPVRHKPGRNKEWRIEIESAAIVFGCVAATTTEELKEVI